MMMMMIFRIVVFTAACTQSVVRGDSSVTTTSSFDSITSLSTSLLLSWTTTTNRILKDNSNTTTNNDNNTNNKIQQQIQCRICTKSGDVMTLPNTIIPGSTISSLVDDTSCVIIDQIGRTGTMSSVNKHKYCTEISSYDIQLVCGCSSVLQQEEQEQLSTLSNTTTNDKSQQQEGGDTITSSKNDDTIVDIINTNANANTNSNQPSFGSLNIQVTGQIGIQLQNVTELLSYDTMNRYTTILGNLIATYWGGPTTKTSTSSVSNNDDNYVVTKVVVTVADQILEPIIKRRVLQQQQIDGLSGNLRSTTPPPPTTPTTPTTTNVRKLQQSDDNNDRISTTLNHVSDYYLNTLLNITAYIATDQLQTITDISLDRNDILSIIIKNQETLLQSLQDGTFAYYFHNVNQIVPLENLQSIFPESVVVVDLSSSSNDTKPNTNVWIIVPITVCGMVLIGLSFYRYRFKTNATSLHNNNNNGRMVHTQYPKLPWRKKNIVAKYYNDSIIVRNKNHKYYTNNDPNNNNIVTLSQGSSIVLPDTTSNSSDDSCYVIPARTTTIIKNNNTIGDDDIRRNSNYGPLLSSVSTMLSSSYWFRTNQIVRESTDDGTMMMGGSKIFKHTTNDTNSQVATTRMVVVDTNVDNEDEDDMILEQSRRIGIVAKRNKANSIQLSNQLSVNVQDEYSTRQQLSNTNNNTKLDNKERTNRVVAIQYMDAADIEACTMDRDEPGFCRSSDDLDNSDISSKSTNSDDDDDEEEEDGSGSDSDSSSVTKDYVLWNKSYLTATVSSMLSSVASVTSVSASSIPTTIAPQIKSSPSQTIKKKSLNHRSIHLQPSSLSNHQTNTRRSKATTRKGTTSNKKLGEDSRTASNSDDDDDDDADNDTAAISFFSTDPSTFVKSLNTNNMVRKIIHAPPGKLGIVLDSTKYGQVVREVTVSSPLRHQLFVGDIIIAIDTISTQSLNSVSITELMLRTAGLSKQFTVLSERDIPLTNNTNQPSTLLHHPYTEEK